MFQYVKKIPPCHCRQGETFWFIPLLAAALAYKGHTVGALGNGGVSLVCSYFDGLERAVMLVCKVVLAA